VLSGVPKADDQVEVTTILRTLDPTVGDADIGILTPDAQE
jgi:hypothetical protein